MAGIQPNAMIWADILDAEYAPGTGTVEAWKPVTYVLGGIAGRGFPCYWSESASDDDDAADADMANSVAVARMRYHPAIYAAASVDTHHLRVLLYGDKSREYRLIATAENVNMQDTEMILRLRRWTVR